MTTILTDAEKIVKGDGSEMVAYWFGDDTDPKQYGVCFPGGYFNIARQSMAESVDLALNMLDDAIDTIPDHKADKS